MDVIITSYDISLTPIKKNTELVRYLHYQGDYTIIGIHLILVGSIRNALMAQQKYLLFFAA